MKTTKFANLLLVLIDFTSVDQNFSSSGVTLSGCGKGCCWELGQQKNCGFSPWEHMCNASGILETGLETSSPYA